MVEEEVSEKDPDVQASEIARTKSKVEGHTPSVRGHSQGSNGMRSGAAYTYYGA
jgi:hypothetical protein